MRKISDLKYQQLEIREPMENVFVGEMKINGRKSFNLNFINDLTDFFMFVYEQKNIDNKNRFFVFKGEEGSGIFNLGGDLKLFLELVEKKDILKLQMYGRQCVDLIYKSIQAKNSGMTTVALINGHAKGGGFESTLACDIIIAEKDYKIDLPEIALGFFPGMGAFELLTKRIGIVEAKKFIFSGKSKYTNELYELGVFDYLVERGKSEEELLNIVKKERASQTTYNSVRKICDRLNPVFYHDLIDTVDLWVDSILDISEENKSRINRVIETIDKRYK